MDSGDVGCNSLRCVFEMFSNWVKGSGEEGKGGLVYTPSSVFNLLIGCEYILLERKGVCILYWASPRISR